jgi:hypothetical protein
MGLCQLVESHTFGIGPGQIRGARDAQCPRRIEKRLTDRQRRQRLADAKGSAFAVLVVVPGIVVLGPPEIGQHIRRPPAGAAHLPPVVIVLRVPARVDLGVDGRPAADDPSLGITQDPPA